jgi:hypothetical protein
MFSNDAQFISLVASSDMRTRINHIVDLTSTVFKCDLAAAKAGFGVLANAPNAGENAQVAVDGIHTIRAGAAIAVGDMVTAAASGYGAVWVAGAVATLMGRALTAAASGSLCAVKLRVVNVSS